MVDVALAVQEHRSAMHIPKTAFRTISARTSRMPVVVPGTQIVVLRTTLQSMILRLAP